jgi:hypothetical protein
MCRKRRLSVVPHEPVYTIAAHDERALVGLMVFGFARIGVARHGTGRTRPGGRNVAA